MVFSTVHVFSQLLEGETKVVCLGNLCSFIKSQEGQVLIAGSLDDHGASLDITVQ